MLERRGVLDGMPVFLDEETMMPVPSLCEYGRYLSTALLDETTLKDYGRVIGRVDKYLTKLGSDILSAVETDLVSYRSHRTQWQEKPIGGSAWGKESFVLDDLYGFLVNRGLLSHRPARVAARGRNALAPRVRSSMDIRHLTFDQYRYFRDVGFGGQLPDAQVDLRFRGWSPLRNRAGSDIALGSGMRWREWSTVLLPEIGLWPGMPSGAAEFTVQACAKYGKARPTSSDWKVHFSLELEGQGPGLRSRAASMSCRDRCLRPGGREQGLGGAQLRDPRGGQSGEDVGRPVGEQLGDVDLPVAGQTSEFSHRPRRDSPLAAADHRDRQVQHDADVGERLVRHGEDRSDVLADRVLGRGRLVKPVGWIRFLGHDPSRADGLKTSCRYTSRIAWLTIHHRKLLITYCAPARVTWTFATAAARLRGERSRDGTTGISHLRRRWTVSSRAAVPAPGLGLREGRTGAGERGIAPDPHSPGRNLGLAG